MPAGVWLNGELVEKLGATIGALDHGLLFGDGVTVGTRIHAGVPWRLDAYLARLERTAEAVRLTLPHSRAEFAEIAAAVIASSGRTEGYFKLVVTRGAGMLGPDPRKCEPAVIALADDFLPYPAELLAGGVTLAVSSWSRRRGQVSDFGGVLANVGAVLAMNDALEAGCLDALILTDRGTVSGTISGALAWSAGGRLSTAPAGDSPDPVVTAALVELFGATEVEATLAEVRAADEVCLAGGGFGVVPARNFGRGPGEVVGRLVAAWPW